jgi:hypothetical protein
MITKLLIGLFAAGVIATAGWAAATSVDTDPARTVSLPGATTSATTAAATTDEAEDISGPCDEAEHRNDPRCTGGATADDRADEDARGDDARGGDDRSGHGPGGGDDDRSGSNSGKG